MYNGVLSEPNGIIWSKKCGRHSLEVNEYSEAPRERLNRSEITYSVVAAPIHLCSSAENNNNYQMKLIECDSE